MKYTKTTTCLLTVALVYSCNPIIYDSLYKAIILQAIHSKMNREDVELRNNDIETLRALCKGQVSTYERGKK